MNKIKLIALDIDGTLLNDEGEVTSGIKKIIKNTLRKGIYVILCTGRMYQSAKQFLYLLNERMPNVTYNGSLIKYSNKTIYCKNLPNSKNKEILNKIITYKLQPNIYTEDELYSISGNPFIEKYSQHTKVDYKLINKRKISELLNRIKIIKIAGIGSSGDVDRFIKEEKNNYKNDIFLSKSFDYFLEVSHKNTNKGKALEIIGKKFNINTKEMMAIGDNFNDKEMLDTVGFPVLMGNGTEELKNNKYFITKSNNNNGVEYAISQFIS